MPPDDRDAGYLWDMIETARLVVSITANVTYDAFLQNRTLQLAVERAIEIVGEAARNVSEAYRSSTPEVPWKAIIAQRHVLAHEYGEIAYDRIWRVVTIHIPALISTLETLVPDPPLAP